MKKKSLVAAILCLIMVLTFATPAASAIQLENVELDSFQSYFAEDVSRATLQRAAAGYELLEEGQLPVAAVSSIQEKADGTIAYYLDYGGVVDEVIPSRQIGGILYQITEGSKYNELFVADNGDFYLNGNLCTVTYDNAPSITVTPARISQNSYWTEDCPYGSSYEYNVYVDTRSVSGIHLEEAIINISLSVFVFVVVRVLFPGAVEVVSDIYMAFFEAYDGIVKISPYTESISGFVEIFNHRDAVNDYWIIQNDDYRMGVQKQVGTIYPETNYQGTPSSLTLFNWFEYFYD